MRKHRWFPNVTLVYFLSKCRTLALTDPRFRTYVFTRPCPDRSRLYLDHCAFSTAHGLAEGLLGWADMSCHPTRASTSLAMLPARGQRYLLLSPAVLLSFTPPS
jgi:hypothetical protein